MNTPGSEGRDSASTTDLGRPPSSPPVLRSLACEDGCLRIRTVVPNSNIPGGTWISRSIGSVGTVGSPAHPVEGRYACIITQYAGEADDMEQGGMLTEMCHFILVPSIGSVTHAENVCFKRPSGFVGRSRRREGAEDGGVRNGPFSTAGEGGKK